MARHCVLNAEIRSLGTILYRRDPMSTRTATCSSARGRRNRWPEIVPLMSVTVVIEWVIEECLFEAVIVWINPGDAPGDAECRESLLECSLN